MDKGKKKREQTKAAVSNEDHKTKYVKNNKNTHTHTRTFFKLVFPTRLNSWLANGGSKAKHAHV